MVVGSELFDNINTRYKVEKDCMAAQHFGLHTAHGNQTHSD